MNNLVPLKFYLNNQNGGSKSSIFIPYEEHHLMKIDEREKHPIYCPDLYPFLCKKNTEGFGLCKKSDVSCNNKLEGKIPIHYN